MIATVSYLSLHCPRNRHDSHYFFPFILSLCSAQQPRPQPQWVWLPCRLRRHGRWHCLRAPQATCALLLPYSCSSRGRWLLLRSDCCVPLHRRNCSSSSSSSNNSSTFCSRRRTLPRLVLRLPRRRCRRLAIWCAGARERGLEGALVGARLLRLPPRLSSADGRNRRSRCTALRRLCNERMWSNSSSVRLMLRPRRGLSICTFCPIIRRRHSTC